MMWLSDTKLGLYILHKHSYTQVGSDELCYFFFSWNVSVNIDPNKKTN